MNPFVIRRSERLTALFFLIVILILQYLMISKFWCLFANYSDESFNIFLRNYHMSGFDPISYDVLTNWHQGYDILRHPLLGIMMYPVYLLNQFLWWITGANCAQLLMGFILSVCSFYSFLFLNRTIRDVITTSPLGTAATFLFTSFAYILVTTVVADHFCLSMFCLIFTTYKAAKKIKNKQTFTAREMGILFLITAGITLSNGVVIIGIFLITNGMQFFTRKNFLALLLSSAVLTLPVATSTINSNAQKENIVERQMRWTKNCLSKEQILQENFFGESLQLHRKYVLGDVLHNRPVLVSYSWKFQNYVVIAIELLLIAGLIVGIRQRFTLILLWTLAFNILLHIILGFAIEEVYIMTAHWTFVIPLAIASLFNIPHKRTKIVLAAIVTCIAAYLLLYNGFLLHRYLTWPLNLN